MGRGRKLNDPRPLLEILLEMYPDKRVTKLGGTSLYQRVRKEAGDRSIEEYLESLGFFYDNAKKKVRLADVLRELEALYPDRIIHDFSELFTKHQPTYTVFLGSHIERHLLLYSLNTAFKSRRPRVLNTMFRH